MSALDFLTNYEVDEVPSFLEVRSDKVTPISTDAANRKYIFRLEPQGYLDSNTLLQFKVYKAAGAGVGDTQLRVNSFNGILGSVKRCILKVGDFVLNDTDNVNKWSTLTNLASRRRSDLNRYNAYYLGNQFHSVVSETAGDSYGQMEVDDDLSGYDFTSRLANSLLISTDENACYKYGIPLGQLIPAIQGRQIPLFLFEQYRINIEVEFHPPQVYMNAAHGGTGTAVATSAAATISQVELLVDYIIYPSSVLEEQRAQTQKEGGLQLEFFNVVNIQRQLDVTQTSTAGDATVDTAAKYLAFGALQGVKTQQEFRIGQENREVHQVFMVKQKQDRVDDSGGAATNEASLMLGQRIDGIAYEEIQWKVNGVDAYPDPKSSTASQYDQLYFSLGYKDLQMERPMFYTDANSISAGTTALTSGLQGTYKPIGLDLRVQDTGIVGSGTLLGKYPLVLKYKCDPSNALSAFGTANTGSATSPDQSGVYDVDFIVTTSRRAVIQSTAAGMRVSVSF